MQLGSASSVSSSSVLAGQNSESVKSSISPVMQFDQYKVIRRNGSVVAFEPTKISIAMTKAFIAVNGGQGAASARVREMGAMNQSYTSADRCFRARARDG